MKIIWEKIARIFSILSTKYESNLSARAESVVSSGRVEDLV